MTLFPCRSVLVLNANAGRVRLPAPFAGPPQQVAVDDVSAVAVGAFVGPWLPVARAAGQRPARRHKAAGEHSDGNDNQNRLQESSHV